MRTGACLSKVGILLQLKSHTTALGVSAVEGRVQLTHLFVGSSTDESKTDGVGGDETGGLLRNINKMTNFG